MFALSCLQCKQNSNNKSNRLVKDACGHQKCRMCLLKDEEECQQCKSSEVQQNSVIKFENNHTRVIQCNGTPKKPAEVVQNGGAQEELMVRPATPPLLKKKKEKILNKRDYSAITIPNHISTLKDPIRYECSICRKQFSTKSHVKYHFYCTGQTKPFQCTLCKKEFVTKSHLTVHMLKHSESKPHTCHICQKSFREKSKLNRHSLLHSTTKPHVCSECGKAFRGKESLKIHTLIHRGEKAFTCRICSASFVDNSNLNKHLISHSNEKAHMCDQCGKRFKQKWALTVHRRSHLRLRPHECSTCSRTFVNNKDLQRHQLIHLESKAFNCSICMTGFRRKDNLYRHVKNTHPGKKIEPILSTVKQLLIKPPTTPTTTKIIDNPNAINVITTANKKTQSQNAEVNSEMIRSGTVINGPLKLAFKTSTFKSNYNIHNRDCDYELMSSKMTKPYDLAESVNICQKILSPHSPPTSRNIIRKINEQQQQQQQQSSSTEICQKILASAASIQRPIHYETSFEHKKHAIIKNIKFKLPANYTNLNNNVACKKKEEINEIIGSNNNNNNNVSNGGGGGGEVNKNVQSNNSATSVIVNSNLCQSSMHWRRRTSQNFSKILEN